MSNKNSSSDEHRQSNSTPVFAVAIGASEGGEQAVKELVDSLPADSGMAFVYIQANLQDAPAHLIPALREVSKIPIAVADEPVQVKADHFYIIPADRQVEFRDGSIVPLLKNKPIVSPINKAFSSLSENWKELAIGVLLSGNEIDGVVGLKNIKFEGGLTFAQDSTAEYQSMPSTAVSEGAADVALSPKEIALELTRIARKKDFFYTAIKKLDDSEIDSADEDLSKILHLLQKVTGVNFSQYKQTTIKRRIIRRMMLFKMEYLHDYYQLVQDQPAELNLLYQDLLINVTAFFRDTETCEYLRNVLFPEIIKIKGHNDPIRIWIPACSTGQEAYSLAMLLLEALGNRSSTTPIQIFATDLSESAINIARQGIYSKADVQEVPPQFTRYFTKKEGSYRIVKSIRDLCVFAHHNVAKDPPFSKLDIISCCNLLIYLDVSLQKKLLATFHYSLTSNGYLVLGKSETVGGSAYLFNHVEKKVRVYGKKKDAIPKAVFDLSFRTPDYEKYQRAVKNPFQPDRRNDETDLEREVDELLLKKYTPASVIVNSELDILQFRGSTGLYLEPSPGKASLNLLKMARPGLGFELKNVVHKAKKTREAASKSGLEIKIDGKAHAVSIQALPLILAGGDEYYLVVFEETRINAVDSEAGNAKDRRVRQLEAELNALREDMRSILEAQEAANEELQSANEEIVSSNEELQSINEELETSKEEIESSNEELITINQELQVRNEQLAEEQEYSQIVFTAIRESLLILDENMRVKSCNKAFQKTFAAREEDLEGRYLFEVANRQWDFPEMRELLEVKLTKDPLIQGHELSHVFQGVGEKTLVLNIQKIPKRSNHQQVTLIAFEDITEHRRSQKLIADREAWFRHMADNAPVMIWVTGLDKLCTFANKTFVQFRGISLEESIGVTWTKGAHPDDVHRCIRTYDVCFEEKRPFELEYRLRRHDGEYKTILTKAKPHFTHEGHFTGFIGSCTEIS